jgi:hypothetical protein
MVDELTPTPEAPAPIPEAPAPAPDVPAAPAPEAPVSPADAAAAAAFTEDIPLEGLKFGGQDVNVTIPADVANYTAELGLDAQELANELYGSEDFTLSQETLDKLYAKVPKWQVDSYLSGIKAANSAMLDGHKAESEAKTQAEEAAWNATLEIMGGEDRWNDMAAFAEGNLSDEELEEFNDVMKNGTLYVQQLAIKDLWSKFDASGAPAAPAQLDLEEGDNQGSPAPLNSAVSAEEYIQAITNGEYEKDPNGWDQRRRAGMAKGL